MFGFHDVLLNDFNFAVISPLLLRAGDLWYGLARFLPPFSAEADKAIGQVF